MPLRHATDPDDEELVRYVLGLLPDAARARLDEASIADDDVAERLRAAETDLIDRYVRKRLAGETLERFESYYLSSPLRRKNVRLAAAFVDAVDRSAAGAASVPWTHRIARSGRFVRMAAVAALVMVVSGVILFRAVRPGNERTIAASASDSVERTLDPPQQPAGARAAVSSAPVSAEPGGQPTVPPEQIVAMVLLPPTRSVAVIPTLALPEGTDRIRFELQLESNDFPSYRVGLKNPATGQILWRSEWIAPDPAPDQASISVVVPANLLGPRHYSLDLAGRGAGGRDEVIGSYPVRIVQP